MEELTTTYYITCNQMSLANIENHPLKYLNHTNIP